MNRLNNLYYLIYLLSLPLFSQELGEITIYNTDNSNLSYNQINCLEFDNENRLWIGTQNGLSIFDEINNSWINAYSGEQNCLPTNIITALERDDFCDGSTMFIGTTEGMTYAWWDSGQFGNQGQGAGWCPNYGLTCAPNNGIIKSILHNNNAIEVWAGSTDGLCVDGLGGEDTWLIQNTTTGFYSNNITSIKQNLNTGLIGIGTMNGGLVTYNGNFAIYYSSNSDILDNTVLDLAFDQNNNIIICTPQAGLGVLTSTGSWVWLNTLNSNLPTNSLKKVVVDNNNNLWIATLEDGLVHYIDNTFYHYNTENSSLPDDNINCLEFGPNNNLWLGTVTNGLVKITTPTLSNNSELINPVRVYPTIFNDVINLELGAISDIKIYNQKGEIIDFYNTSKGYKKINTANYKSGLYFINIISNKHIETHKLIKY